MAELTLNAEKRSKLGGSTANQLRNQGRVPGIIYGQGEPSIAFHVKELDLRSLIYTHETHTVKLTLDGETLRCILREVQFHPVTDRVSHIDLIKILAGQKIKIDVPINLVGSPAGVKDGGVMDFVLHKLSIECLPDAIPEHIDVNVLRNCIGQALDAKLMEDEVHNAAIFHTGRRADEIDRHVDLDLLACKDLDKINVTYAVRYRMELHFAK